MVNQTMKIVLLMVAIMCAPFLSLAHAAPMDAVDKALQIPDLTLKGWGSNAGLYITGKSGGEKFVRCNTGTAIDSMDHLWITSSGDLVFRVRLEATNKGLDRPALNIHNKIQAGHNTVVKTMDRLDAGQTKDQTVDLAVPSHTSVPVTVELDFERKIPESSETNNQCTVHLNLANLKPQVAIQSFRLKQMWHECQSGKPVYLVDVTVVNRGTAWNRDIYSLPIYDTHTSQPNAWKQLGSPAAIQHLRPGGSQTLTFAIPYYDHDPPHMWTGAPHVFKLDLVGPLDKIQESRELSLTAPAACLTIKTPTLPTQKQGRLR